MPIQEGEISLENLKFRAWDKKYKEMIRVVCINFDEEFIRGLSEVESNLDIESSYNFEDIELLQSTGLFDKNGTEIYEGDILHHKVQGVGVVFYPFRDTMASFGIRNVNTRFGRNLQDTAKAGYEIIGNKFENPELLREDWLMSYLILKNEITQAIIENEKELRQVLLDYLSLNSKFGIVKLASFSTNELINIVESEHNMIVKSCITKTEILNLLEEG